MLLCVLYVILQQHINAVTVHLLHPHHEHACAGLRHGGVNTLYPFTKVFHFQV